MNIVHLETLESYHDKGLLIKREHPKLPLTIWNYSVKTQYEGLWDSITTLCRGLVVDELGNIIARPFKKFFSLEHEQHTPTKNFDVFEKMDGSLIVCFNYNNQWICASRGSFDSELADKANKLLNNYDKTLLKPEFTYMFELVSPDNRIIIKYEYEDLIMLGAISTKTGYDADIHTGYYDSFNLVKKYDSVKDYTRIKETIGSSREGVVVKFSNKQRCKIKGNDYLRLHRAMAHLTTKAIWDCLRHDIDVYRALGGIPDEVFNKVKEYENSLRYQYGSIEEQALIEHSIISGATTTRKEYAKEALKSGISPILFNMLEGKPYKMSIWKMIEPESQKIY